MTEPPAQKVVGPDAVMVGGVGGGAADTTIGSDDALQPPASDTPHMTRFHLTPD